jgi:hypothetical protein
MLAHQLQPHHDGADAQELRELFILDDTRVSATQQQLAEMHSHQVGILLPKSVFLYIYCFKLFDPCHFISHRIA